MVVCNSRILLATFLFSPMTLGFGVYSYSPKYIGDTVSCVCIISAMTLSTPNFHTCWRHSFVFTDCQFSAKLYLSPNMKNLVLIHHLRCICYLQCRTLSVSLTPSCDSWSSSSKLCSPLPSLLSLSILSSYVRLIDDRRFGLYNI